MYRLSEEERLGERLEGREESCQERNKEIALIILKEGIEDIIISKTTSLTLNEIQNLKKNT